MVKTIKKIKHPMISIVLNLDEAFICGSSLNCFIGKSFWQLITWFVAVNAERGKLTVEVNSCSAECFW